MSHSKIDMRGVPDDIKCPFKFMNSVRCAERSNRLPHNFQYICECDQDEPAPQSQEV